MEPTVDGIKAFIQRTANDVDVDQLQLDIPLVDQGVDSLDMYNIYLSLEEGFEVSIPDEDVEMVQTINDIIKYIQKKQSSII